MYESPVNLWEDMTRICEEITKVRDEYVFSQIRDVVDVDKEELLKAIRYDRQQYEKGYSDGRAAKDEEIVRCKDCEHYAGEGMYCACDIIVQFDHFYCYDGKRRE